MSDISAVSSGVAILQMQTQLALNSEILKNAVNNQKQIAEMISKSSQQIVATNSLSESLVDKFV